MNPFVNPHQRGIDLPTGCKDLVDLLKPSSAGSSLEPEFVHLRGTDAEFLEEPFHRFYESPDNLLILILVTGCFGYLSLSHHPKPPHLDLCFDTPQTALIGVIHHFFRVRQLSPLLEKTIADHTIIRFPLPQTALQAAELISQLLKQVYRIHGSIQLAYLLPPPTAK